MGSIRLSKKHGVNPSVGICFWCGGDDGTVLLVGKLPGDEQAPPRMLASYDPCNTCKEQFDQGVALVEAHEGPVFEGQDPIQRSGNRALGTGQELYPTGRYVIVKDEAIPRLLHNCDTDDVIARRKAFVDTEAFDKLLERFQEAGLLPTEGDDTK